jgi:hypothetical protein
MPLTILICQKLARQISSDAADRIDSVANVNANAVYDAYAQRA